jgi:hypothetical protein
MARPVFGECHADSDQAVQRGWNKNYVVMIARGLLNTNGLKQILRELAAVTTPCVNCRVLIDVIDAEYKVKQLLAGAVETRRLAAVGFSFIAVGSGGLWNTATPQPWRAREVHDVTDEVRPGFH